MKQSAALMEEKLAYGHVTWTLEVDSSLVLSWP
jgi:hypothetical protein